ncbi:MAG: ATP-dependent DNA ligase [Actinobacteria bacterium]|nr:ATP-dependent DNA ligase [Actinomycetota bacterium]MCI0677675.1 ATP-dependent DNA ligase [Actinomycetota bacterium]
MRLAELVSVSEAVASTRARSAKTALLADLLRRLTPVEAPVAVAYLAGRPLQDRLGVGYATVYGVDPPPAPEPTLELTEVDRILDAIASTSGPGSRKTIEARLTELFSAATLEEQGFLRGLILRNLRQGALEGVMADAVAQALGVEAERVRRAAMLEGDLVIVASHALAEGPGALATARLQVFTPVQPMLAVTAETAGGAVALLGTAVVEWKLDGVRIQVHRNRDEVRLFTRNLRDVTSTLPELTTAALELAPTRFILDGEAILVDRDGNPRGFQDSMSSFSTEIRGRAALTPFYFDILHLDGVDLIDAPLTERRAVLGQIASEHLVTGILTSDPDEADRFAEAAVAAGYEGVMVKDPDQTYEAGRRGSGWMKVKPTHTLDLLVLAAEWGSGRREGWLSNLHLGARDPAGGFVMLGKTFKGLTDEMLAWQTRRFLEIEERREGHIVYLRPEVVYEIAFDGVQRSTRYPGGVALRFARVRRHRDDKDPDDVDTIETVRSLLK